MSQFTVDERTERPRAEADGLLEALPALDTDVVIDKGPSSQEP
jgi:hypothetical protein